MPKFVVNHIRGRMWLPEDIDLNGGVDGDELTIWQSEQPDRFSDALRHILANERVGKVS